MTKLCCDVLASLKGKTLVTAESCTGGAIGAALTDIPGSSSVYKGGIICYSNWVKEHVLSVSPELLEQHGAVSAPVAEYMALGARKLLKSNVAVSVTGLAGPSGDEYGHSVGTVFIGCSTEETLVVKEFHFYGDRSQVRNQAVIEALKLILDCQMEE